jgi:hypothetical protein
MGFSWSGAPAWVLLVESPEWSDFASVEGKPMRPGLGLGTKKPSLAGGIEQSLDVLTCLVLVAVKRQAIGDLLKALFAAVSEQKAGGHDVGANKQWSCTHGDAGSLSRQRPDVAVRRGHTKGCEAEQSLRRKRPPR